MCENVLKCISELECINISETELNMSVNNEFCEPQDFTAQMESVSEAGLLALFGCQSSKAGQRTGNGAAGIKRLT